VLEIIAVDAEVARIYATVLKRRSLYE